MANYLGSTYKPATPRTDENFALMVQVAQMKQSVYDAKKAQINQTLEAFGNIDVLREQDKEYIAAKLNSIRTDINGYGNRDLSQSGVGEELMSKIKVAAQDPFIQGAMEDSYKFRSFQQTVAKKQEKGDGSYSDVNYAYALNNSGYDAYMRGDQKRLGNLQYSDYTDYNKKINDFIIDLEGKKKDQTIQVQEIDSDGKPTGRMIEQTISGLSPQQLRSVATTMLDANDQKQIEIDGWYNNGGYDNPNIIANVQSILNSDIQEKDSRIKSIDIKLKAGGLSPEEKASYETERVTINSQKANILKNIDVLKSNPKAAATYLEQQKVLDNTVARFAGLYTESREVTKDDAYWAQKNYDLDIAKFKYTQQKDTLDAQATQTGENLTVVSQGIPQTESEIASYEKDVDNTIAETSQALNNDTMRYKSLVEAEALKGNKDAQNLMDIYNTKLGKKTKEQSDVDIFRAVVTENVDSNNPLSLLGGENNVMKIKQGVDKVSLYTKGKEEAEKRARIEHIDKTLNTQEVFTAYNRNKNTQMLWNGVATPVHRVLKQAGLMSEDGTKIGDIKNAPEVLGALQNSYYADDIITAFNYSGDISEDNRSLRSLLDSFGETVADVFGKEGEATNLYERNLNPNTKTGQFIINAKQQGIYDRFSFSDQSLTSDDSDIASFTQQSWKESETYRQDLAKYRDKLPNSQLIGISPTDKAIFDRVITMAQSQDNSFNPSKDRTIRIQKVGDFIEVSQSDEVGTGNDKETISQPVQVTWQDFQRNLPSLAQRIEFDSQSAIYTYDKLQDTPLISEPVKYLQDKSNEMYEYNSEVLLNQQPQFKGYLTATDSKSTLKRNNYALSQRIPDTNSLIDIAVNNSSNYGVQISMTAKYGTPKLHLKLVDKKTEDIIHTISQVGYSDADNFKDILDSAPQVYYSMLINDILQKQLNDLTLGSTNESYQKLRTSLKIQ